MLALTEIQAAQCHKFLDELYLWNEKINLTSIERAQAWARHIDESVALAGRLPDGMTALADVGSGGGIPGIVLAIALPETRVALIEADRRKAGFLMHVSGLLELTNIEVVAQRVEVAATMAQHAERYDVAVSRAAGPLDTVIGWCLPLVCAGGMVFVMSDEAGSATFDTKWREGLVMLEKTRRD